MFTQKFLPKIKKIKKQFSSVVFKKPEPCLDLVSFQNIFNMNIKSFLDTKLQKYKTYSDNCIAHETIGYAASIMQNGGKRIRPYLMYLAFYNEDGLEQKLILKAGLAIELFHTFVLIHDDVIDNGLERHGEDTVHEYLKKTIDTYPRGDKTHVSKGLAMLAGDLLFSWANEIIAEINDTRVSAIYFKMIEEIVVGQILDVSFMLQYEVKTEEILRKNELKTALYSFVNPMCIGSVLAQGEHLDLYTKLGLCIGRAYQIQDDLLDIIGDSHITGKSTFLDIEDGQHTILTQYIFEHANEKDKNIFLSLFGKKIDEHGKKVLLNLYTDTGAISYAENEIKNLFNSAKEILENSQMKKDTKQVWLHFMEIILKRKS